MLQKEKYEVELTEIEWKYGKDGSVEYSPLQDLASLSPIYGPISHGCLTFAGHDLYLSKLLENVRAFELTFHGEMPNERYREAWADPIRADVLKYLSGENQSWYISFVGDITERLLNNDGRKVPEKIYKYFSGMDPKRVVTVKSEKPSGYGCGFEKRIFFEIPNEEIEWAVKNIWPQAMEIYPIEGYNLPLGRMDLIKKWDQEQRDDRLFQEVMKNSLITFFTSPAEHTYFEFLTVNFDFNELAQKINLEELQRKANEIEEKIYRDGSGNS